LTATQEEDIASSDPETRLVIMLAEHDPYAAELAEYFLRTEGYETIVVLDARAAEALFDERSPNLAVVDLLISGGSGPGLCRSLRDRGALVLAISSLSRNSRLVGAAWIGLWVVSNVTSDANAAAAATSTG